MLEGEFILDGYAFGTPAHDVIILSGGLDTGSVEVRSQDAQVRDNTLFGRDYLTGPTWGFSLGINTEDVDTALMDLARVWRNPAIRLTPGQLSVLRFRRNGRDYRVYGRPRRFGVSPQDVASDDWQVVEVDFRMADAFMYADAEESVTIALGENTIDDGVILPETMPWLFGYESATGSVVANVQTLDPTPFTVTINPVDAPVSQMSVEGPGWAIDIDTTVNPGSLLVIDTRANTAMIDGASVAGALSRRSSLAARLWNGPSTISFTGTSTTGSATATVSWRGSYPII